MKITDKRKREMKDFKNLKLEDVFRWDGRLFMKVSMFYDDDDVNAYDFNKGRLTGFTKDTEVEYIPAELILHGGGWEE